MNERPRCQHCGDVIGSLEPMVVVSSGQARITSTTAEREHHQPDAQRYHEACYQPLRQHDN